MATFFDAARKLRLESGSSSLAKLHDDVTRAQEVLQQSFAKSRLDIMNLEEVFTALEMAETVGALGPLASPDIQSARQSLVQLLEHTISHTQRISTQWSENPQCPLVASGPRGYSELASLVSLLFEHPPHHEVGFLTFNYDVGLELALATNQLPFSYCMDTNLSPAFSSLPVRKFPPIPVCKLHGSLNWLAVPRADNTPASIKYFDPCAELILQHQRGPNREVILDTAAGLRRIASPSGTGEARPLIVPPTESKATARQTMAPIWTKAGQLLREAENIFVIGFSLPETDMFFRRFFSVCMISNTMVRRLWICDASNAPYQRFEQIVGPALTSRAECFKRVPSHWCSGGFKAIRDEIDKYRALL